MITTSAWHPWQGTLCRRAYLLAKGTAMGWHTFNGEGFCCHCHQQRQAADPLCREFLVAIPAVTSAEHDAPTPAGRLF